MAGCWEVGAVNLDKIFLTIKYYKVKVSETDIIIHFYLIYRLSSSLSEPDMKIYLNFINLESVLTEEKGYLEVLTYTFTYDCQ